tara:strand:+ start:219 stop:773 length:555 start_codon:yes stop_codon:yes gene_type:complete
VNKSFVKFIADFGPLLIFFTVYYRNDKNIIDAIPALVVATVIATIVLYVLEKKIPYLPLFGTILVCIFGGLTFFFNNPIFIYLKPTIINIVFAFALIFGKVLFKKNLLKIVFKGSLKLNETGWTKLNYRWAAFFIFLAILNEIVWRTQTEEIWVNFKVWGILPLTFVFTAFQIPLITKYKNNEE